MKEKCKYCVSVQNKSGSCVKIAAGLCSWTSCPRQQARGSLLSTGGVYMQLKKTEHASSGESSGSYLMRSVPHTFSIRLNNPHIYRPPPCSRRRRLRQLVHFGKVSRCSLIMVTNINQIKAVTATVGRHRNEQCGFQRLNGSTARGRSYHSLSCVYRCHAGPSWFLF